MSYHDISNMRLEVEIPTAGLPNLVQNPHGEKGGWGYLTPTTGATMSGYLENGQNYLSFHTTTAGAAHFTTEFLSVAAGQYVAARFFNAFYKSNVNMKARFEFYRADKTLISSSAQTAATATSVVADWATDGNTYYVPAALAPANTAYVKLRFDVYKGTGNLTAGDWIDFNQVMVTHASSTAGLGTSKTNLVTNPSFETNTTGWSGGDAPNVGSGFLTTITRSSTVGGASGSWALRLADTTGDSKTTTRHRAHTDAMTVTGGGDYAFQAKVRAPTTGIYAYFYVHWYTSGGALISPSRLLTTVAEAATGSWTTMSGVLTAPSNAASCRVQIEFEKATAFGGGDVAGYVDAVMVEKASTVNAYYEGTVVATSADYAFSEPNDWRNILGPAHEIKVTRAGLDVGLMNATVLDPLLDPSVEDDVRPGKKVRLRAYTYGAWRSVFEGKLTTALVNYVKSKEDGSLSTRIQISASDAVAHLANQGESRGVRNVSDLPFILEGKGVPWSVNGSGDQEASATVVSYNENASVMDQVAIVRDTNQAQAYLSRDGVLTARDSSEAPPLAFDWTDGSPPVGGWNMPYTDIDITFSTEECINSVVVKWLQYDVGAGSTKEILYPQADDGTAAYVDPSSVTQWGAHQAEFTIQGNDWTATSIRAFANSILAANATPVIRPNSLTYVVTDELSMDVTVWDDLTYETEVYFEGAAYTVRISGIEHNITPDKWQVSYKFSKSDSVAPPTWTPSPPFTGITELEAAVEDTGWVSFGTMSGTDTGWTTGTVNYAEYRRIGKQVHVRINRTQGSSLTFANNNYSNQTFYKGLPSSLWPSRAVMGSGRWADLPQAFTVDAAGDFIMVGGTSGTYAAGSLVDCDFHYFID